ncbi:ATPase [Wenjunlia vitaminophila]|uniref:ATPase n=1 Tax=Wenjunlia vitaminophila TaxID=76728 RepID=A0A0T6LW08_WENVI|nr:ATP-binding protein [Wenjunlia vitaminophila]KRV50200.1 ATPase [Wenjunlia vitaminophila]
MTGPASDEALWSRLRQVEQRVRVEVAARRATDPDPDDPFRGQYLTPEAADRVLADPWGPPAAAAAESAEACSAGADEEALLPPPGTRIGQLAAAFGLLPLDLELLLVVLAPDIDLRFERLYGYLNDDLTRRRPTVDLALRLCGRSAAGPGRFRFAASAPLVARGLVDVVAGDRPLLSRELRAPDRVTAHLLGDDGLDDRLRGLVTPAPGRADPRADQVRRVAAAATTGSGLVHLLDREGDCAGLAVDALLAAGRRPLVLDPVALAAHQDPGTVLRALALEARLTAGGVVLGPLERLEPRRTGRGELLREVCAATAGTPLIVYGAEVWDPWWAAESPVAFPVPPLDAAQRAARWERELAAAERRVGTAVGVRPPLDGELLATVAPYRLDGLQVRRAADVAARTAASERRPVTRGDLRAAVRAQNGAGLARLARRTTPAVTWDDLVLPEVTRRQLDDLALRAVHREQVLGRWRMRPGGGRGHGVIALFAGESGTGKTMSAEVVAGELGMELYVVDLSTVVDKYIGETEKNLERVFTEASQVNGVLLFDEADAVFGKRSEVKDAHDRHANVESAYLLQRMESFDGMAILTTNLRANLDGAFTRRLDAVVEFPVPDAAQRLALWDRCLGTGVVRADDLDLEFCARRFELTGGSIRACAVTAAYLAAEAAGPLTMAQLVSAVCQEYHKLGRLVLESEFGDWFRQVRPDAAAERW